MKNVSLSGLSLALLLFIPIGSSAASNKCEVVEVDGMKLVLECERDNEALEIGDKIKLKTVRKSSAPVEGC